MSEENNETEVKQDVKQNTNSIEEFKTSKEFENLISDARSQAVDKFKADKMKAILEQNIIEYEESKKLTPLQKAEIRIKELEEADAKSKFAIEKQKRDKIIMQSLTNDHNLPSNLIKYIDTSSEETVNQGIKDFKDLLEANRISNNKDEIKQNKSYIPKDEKQINKTGAKMPAETASSKEWQEYFRKIK